MVSSENSYTINGLIIKPAPGTCSSYNIVFFFISRLCVGQKKCYVGRTIRPLHVRVKEHRNAFYKILSDPLVKFSSDYLNDDKDTYSLGAHLVDEHNITE